MVHANHQIWEPFISPRFALLFVKYSLPVVETGYLTFEHLRSFIGRRCILRQHHILALLFPFTAMHAWYSLCMSLLAAVLSLAAAIQDIYYVKRYFLTGISAC